MAVVQQFEELRGFTPTIDASIVNMHECLLKEPMPSAPHVEIFQGTHQEGYGEFR